MSEVLPSMVFHTPGDTSETRMPTCVPHHTMSAPGTGWLVTQPFSRPREQMMAVAGWLTSVTPASRSTADANIPHHGWPIIDQYRSHLSMSGPRFAPPLSRTPT
jgi:hypothetical protein